MRLMNIIQSAESGTIKYTIETDGHISEAVYFQSQRRKKASLCISTQFGCMMGCDFCASKPNTFEQNIDASQMQSIVALIENDLIVKKLMLPSTYDLKGIGEPLMNLEQILLFYHMMKQKDSFAIFKLSTCGIAPRIVQLALSSADFELYLSLHNPFQDEREKIMPISKKYPIDIVISACEDYFKRKRKQIVASYLLLEGINDTTKHFDALIEMLNPDFFRIELLLYNEIDGSSYKRISNVRAEEARVYLKKHGLQTKIVPSHGVDISGGCGQLRNFGLSPIELP